MWLTIDIGNSRIKTGLFDKRTLVAADARPWKDSWEAHVEAAVHGNHPERIGICSVVPAKRSRVLALLERISDAPILDVHPALALPFVLAYRTPETLGADRLAAAAAAWHHYSDGRPTVVIDAGTALTIDALQDETYLGGAIGTGPDLEGRALARGTAALPHITAGNLPPAVGQSTAQAIQSGILYGLIDRVHGSVERLAATLGRQPVVVATGGWHALLKQHLHSINHADPNLVLRGIQLLMALNPA